MLLASQSRAAGRVLSDNNAFQTEAGASYCALFSFSRRAVWVWSQGPPRGRPPGVGDFGVGAGAYRSVRAAGGGVGASLVSGEGPGPCTGCFGSGLVLGAESAIG